MNATEDEFPANERGSGHRVQEDSSPRSDGCRDPSHHDEEVYIGTRTNSKKMKNTIASSARKTPIIADSSSSIHTMTGLVDLRRCEQDMGRSTRRRHHERADAVDPKRPAHAERLDPGVGLHQLVAALERLASNCVSKKIAIPKVAMLVT